MTSENNIKFTFRDYLQFSIYLVTCLVFLITISNKTDLALIAITELKIANKENLIDDKATKLLMQNQINTNSLQIQLLQKDIENLKKSYFIVK